MQPFEMKPQVEASLAAYRQWANFQDELGKHISLAALEAERKAF
jgi:hypothetical protein